MSLQQKKSSLLNSLKKVYPSDIEKIWDEIVKLVNFYKPKISKKAHSLSEKDIILISYGDSIKKPDELPLESLKNLYTHKFSEFINTIHILPFYPYTSDDGFSVIDYKKVNPELGTWDNIQDLNKHANLMFDAVINHISQKSDWFQKYLQNDTDFQDYFIEVDPNADLSDVVRPRALPLLTPFTDKDNNKKHVWSTFSADQIDINFASPKVFLAVLDVLLFYMQQGSKLIRLDAIAFLWKKIGTSCIHLPQTHEIIRIYKSILTTLDPDLVLITETNVPHQENISYFGNGTDEADMIYNFSLSPLLIYSVKKQDVSNLHEFASSVNLPSNKVCFFNFTASHDGVGVRPLEDILTPNEINELVQQSKDNNGFVSYKNNPDGSQSPYELNCNYFNLLSSSTTDTQTRVNRFLLTQAVMLSMPGVPGIYIHSLLGSENDLEGVKKSGIKRRINREKLNFDTLLNELSNEKSIRYLIFTQYKKIIEGRIKHRAFHPFGKAEYFIENNGNLWIIHRTYKKSSLWAIFNFSDTVQKCKAKAKVKNNLLSNVSIKNENIWELSAYSFKWYNEHD